MQPFPLSPQPTPIQNSLSPEGGGVGGGEGSEEDLAIDQGWVGGNNFMLYFTCISFDKPLASEHLHFWKSVRNRTKRNPPTDSINLHCRSCWSAGFLSREEANSLSSSCKNTSSKNKHFGPFLLFITPDFSISFFALFIVYMFSSVFKWILNTSKAEKDSPKLYISRLS